jgi:polar amino acid transport system substrate-binding protein
MGFVLMGTGATAPVATAGILDQDRANGVLRLLWLPDAAPFSFDKDGQPAGYEVDLCRRIATIIAPELKIQWRAVGLNDGLTEISRGQADLLCGPITITLARMSQMSFTSPIYIGGPGVMLRTDASPLLAQWLEPERNPLPTMRTLQLENAEPRRIAVVSGSTGAAWLHDIIVRDNLSVTVLQVQSDSAAVKLLKAGQVDAWVGESAVQAWSAAQDPVLSGFQLLSRSPSGEPLAIAMPPDPQLSIAVEAALTRVIRGPDFEPLLNNWFGATAGSDAVVIRGMTPLE